MSRSNGTAKGGGLGGSKATVLPMLFESVEYIVTVGIGSTQSNLTLAFNTGSELTWTQCKPCSSYYPQSDRIFDPSHSSSYANTPCTSPFCSDSGSGICLSNTQFSLFSKQGSCFKRLWILFTERRYFHDLLRLNLQLSNNLRRPIIFVRETRYRYIDVDVHRCDKELPIRMQQIQFWPLWRSGWPAWPCPGRLVNHRTNRKQVRPIFLLSLALIVQFNGVLNIWQD